MDDLMSLLQSLKKRGIQIWPNNGQIQFRAPKGSLLTEELNMLRGFKTEILSILESAPQGAYLSPHPRPAHCDVPLAGMQVLRWNAVCESGDWMMPRLCDIPYRIRGPLDIHALQESIDMVIERYESLRTRITVVDGHPQQQIDQPSKFVLNIVDLARWPAKLREIELMRLAKEFVEEEVSWSKGPLFSTCLYTLSKDENVLVFSLDHMITDRISNAIIVDEVLTLYSGIVRGLTRSLPPVPLQFADYAVWQQQIHDHWLRQHGNYWKAKLSGAPAIRLPFEKGEPKSKKGPGGVVRLFLDERLTDAVRNLARRERTSKSLAMLAACTAALSRWCGQRDMVVPVVDFGRHRVEFTPIVGWLASTLYIRIQMSTTDTLLDLLHNVHAEFFQACEHHDFSRVPLLLPECSADFHFNYLTANKPLSPQHELDIQPFAIKRSTPAVRLAIFLSDSDGRIAVSAYYRTDLFFEATVERFCSSLREATEELTYTPHARVFPKS